MHEHHFPAGRFVAAARPVVPPAIRNLPPDPALPNASVLYESSLGHARDVGWQLPARIGKRNQLNYASIIRDRGSHARECTHELGKVIVHRPASVNERVVTSELTVRRSGDAVRKWCFPSPTHLPPVVQHIDADVWWRRHHQVWSLPAVGKSSLRRSAELIFSSLRLDVSLLAGVPVFSAMTFESSAIPDSISNELSRSAFRNCSCVGTCCLESSAHCPVRSRAHLAKRCARAGNISAPSKPTAIA